MFRPYEKNGGQVSKVVVTGVAGFLGSHVAERLVSEGWEVVGIDNLIGGYEHNIPEKVSFHQLNLADASTTEMDELFAGCELVIHAACTPYEGLSVFSHYLVVDSTVMATVNVMGAAARSTARRVVYMSSMARYGDHGGKVFEEHFDTKPQDPYGIAKVASEELVRNIAETHGIDWVILVPHNIVGPRQKYDDPFRNVASIMTNRMLQGKQPIIYGDGSQVRCFSFIQDVVEPIIKACSSDEAVGEVINIGPDEEKITIQQLASKLAEILDFDLHPIYEEGRPNEVPVATCSAAKARLILDYKTTISLDEGMRELVEWIKSQGAKSFDYHLAIEIVSKATPRAWTERLM